MAIARGQGAAFVANAHSANITCEATKNVFGAYFPSMLAATVEGGTFFGTARECLETLVIETANPNDPSIVNGT